MSTHRAILLLAAGIKQNDHGHWESSDLDEPSDFLGTPGGKVRVLATSYLFQSGEYDFILVPGGRGRDRNIQGTPHPSICEILTSELIKEGIHKEHILGEESANTTYEQLQRATSLLRDHTLNKVDVVTNRYHARRVKAMMEIDPYFHDLLAKKQSQVIDAEDVCIEHDAGRWEELIQQVYAGEAMKLRIQQEEQGIKQIQEGTYRY